MNNNAYMWRPWHLDENLHVTNWAARQMCRQIVRRDPTRPGFWYLSFCHPHPPLQPLRDYIDMYRNIDVPDPYVGDWSDRDPADLDVALQHERQLMRDFGRNYSPQQIRDIRRAFYALVTHIDHQIRIVIGTLRQERLMKDTIIAFTADHGDMLGNHQLWAKHWFYEDSACVPMIVCGTEAQSRDGAVGHHRVDDRLVGWADVMPTLLDLAGIELPAHCEGRSMFADPPQDFIYGAWGDCINAEGASSTRMIRDQRYKLIYYPKGNCVQLFDMVEDRHELHDLAASPQHAQTVGRLSAILIEQLRDDELQWVRDGQLVGVANVPPRAPQPNRGFNGQRGLQMPPPHARPGRR